MTKYVMFHSRSILTVNRLSTTKAAIIFLVFVITIVASGCIEEKNTALEPFFDNSNNSSINITKTAVEEMEETENASNVSIQSFEKSSPLLNEQDEPVIKINSFSIIYLYYNKHVFCHLNDSISRIY